jgi:hypothetical protein
MKSVFWKWALCSSLLLAFSSPLLASKSKSKPLHKEKAIKERPVSQISFADGCKEDREKFCKDVKSGEGRIENCLKGHEANLSKSCKLVRMKHKSARFRRAGQIAAACRPELLKLCPGLKPGEGTRQACLMKHTPELSVSCKNVVSRR